MSTLIEDIEALTEKYDFRKDRLDFDKLMFRLHLLEEELMEFGDALCEQDAEDAVDALIDLTVVALGTLAICNVDIQRAWDEVQRANMSKLRGVKPGREQSGGFDLIKPEGWKAPSHLGNTGRLEAALASSTYESSGGLRRVKSQLKG